MSEDYEPYQWEGLSGMVAAMSDMAAMNRATYNGHIEAGFTPEQAMELTRHAFSELFRSARESA